MTFDVWSEEFEKIRKTSHFAVDASAVNDALCEYSGFYFMCISIIQISLNILELCGVALLRFMESPPSDTYECHWIKGSRLGFEGVWILTSSWSLPLNGNRNVQRKIWSFRARLLVTTISYRWSWRCTALAKADLL